MDYPVPLRLAEQDVERREKVFTAQQVPLGLSEHGVQLEHLPPSAKFSVDVGDYFRPDRPWSGPTTEAIACLETALAKRGTESGQLTLGTDNGPQFTSRRFRRYLNENAIAHRRGGYRDPESQAFIESWFGQFKKRLAWRAEWEILDQARKETATYITSYQHRPHPGIGYQTPTELAATPKRRALHTRAT